MALAVQASIEQFEMPHPSGTGAFQISAAASGLADDAADVPVLFVLDADLNFALAAEIVRHRGAGGQQGAVITVGVGYGATDLMQLAKLRTGDLTPPLSAAGKQALGALGDVVGDQDGGADAFLTFLTDTLAPAIRERFPAASPTNHILFGHSLAGLFASYALLTRPDTFATFLPASPSIWWDGFALLAHLPAFPEKLAGLDRQPRVFVSVGGKEQDLPTKVPAGVAIALEELQALVAHSRMVDAAVEFAGSLREAGLEEVADVVFADEDHGSMTAAALSRGLGFAVPVPR